MMDNVYMNLSCIIEPTATVIGRFSYGPRPLPGHATVRHGLYRRRMLIM